MSCKCLSTLAYTICVLLYHGSLRSQEVPTEASQDSCSFNEIYTPAAKGWPIPGLTGATRSGKRSELPIQGNGPQKISIRIFSTSLKPGPAESQLPMFRCSHQKQGRLTFRFAYVKPRAMVKFDADGLVFCLSCRV